MLPVSVKKTLLRRTILRAPQRERERERETHTHTDTTQRLIQVVAVDVGPLQHAPARAHLPQAVVPGRGILIITVQQHNELLSMVYHSSCGYNVLADSTLYHTLHDTWEEKPSENSRLPTRLFFATATPCHSGNSLQGGAVGGGCS